ncbi:hypothetical protein [Lewinella sp. 4G2]|uniref:hypothetical protein n=1 Tax=Lewinella sp. 4G2 TaxID=1803372 RepID=UPI0007B47D13|nr:hypothetical protein [Lewinella sp. 4G2]OAV45418.1 hypothetical protein A3850_013350 [Lewinella sp. 4G2]
MKIRMITMALLLAFAGVFYSCAEGSDVDQATDEMARETENALANVGAEIREESNEFEAEFKQTRSKIDRRMEEIEKDMENASAEAKAEMQEEWNELEAYGKDIDDRMNRVGNNMEAGWKDFKGDVKKGWNDFSKESRTTLNNIERSLDPEGDLD